MSKALSVDEKGDLMRSTLSTAQDLALKQIGLLHGARSILQNAMESPSGSAVAVASACEVLSVLEVYASNLRRCIEAAEFNRPFAWEHAEPQRM